MLTIEDIAKACGVSKSTVSRVLNNNPHVRPATRERVLRVVRQLQYEPHAGARGLKLGRTYTIGVFVPDIVSPFYAEILRGVNDALGGTPYDLLLYTPRRAESPRAGVLGPDRVDGVILLTPGQADREGRLLVSRGLPVVWVDHRNDAPLGLSVTFDNRKGGYAATRYLIELGHRTIGYVAGIMEIPSSQQRLLGYREAMREAGLKVEPWMVQPGDYTRMAGMQAVERWIRGGTLPTAIFASNDQMAHGAMDALRQHGLRVPQDVSVMGFDDIPVAALLDPPLTTVSQRMYEMGMRAATMLLQRLSGETGGDETERVIIEPTLVIRASCAPPRATA
ncbi:MAG TPA: LacI family DNA-binding transcriptional regulator [Limnochordales bacterium]